MKKNSKSCVLAKHIKIKNLKAQTILVKLNYASLATYSLQDLYCPKHRMTIDSGKF